MAIVYLQAPDILRAFEGGASLQEPFDVWFRKQAKDITGVDLSQPLSDPMPEVYIDWRAK
jgi:hypothetical protein